MLAAAIIVFREFFEAGLIVGIVLAVTRGLSGGRAAIAGGIAAGLVGSVLLALVMGRVAEAFEGAGQNVLNAAILSIAVVMLAWHNVWMARHGREMASHLKETGTAVRDGSKPLFALSLVVALAVLREGSEVVLFLYGVAAADGSSVSTIVGGVLIGVSLGAAVSLLAFLGLLRVPVRHVFGVTTTLITLLAAGMAGQAVAELEQAGLVDVLGAQAWDSSALLPQASLTGRLLHTLVGYSDQPSVLQVLVYGVVLVAILVATHLLAPRRPAAAAPRPKVAAAPAE
jgi:high-affinity iron transporter